MRCAVVGCGLAGLATAYALVKRGVEVVLYDLFPVGEKPGGIESALLHPYPGKKGLRSKYAHDALSQTMHLIGVAERALGKKVAIKNGILRKNWSPEEWAYDLEPYDQDVLITSGVTVFYKEYLKGLFAALSSCVFIQGPMENEKEFDQVVYTIGSGFMDWKIEGVQYVKGQVLLVQEQKKITRSMIGSGHISPTLHTKIVQIGATYEHFPDNDLPNVEEAKKYLAPRIKSFLAPMDTWKIVECRACIRVCHKTSYLPIIRRISDKQVIYTGLGSRGLLYHALYGQYAADEIFKEE